VPELYFIGEVVDVTGWFGGYNFQWARAGAPVKPDSYGSVQSSSLALVFAVAALNIAVRHLVL
jgi:hypothetical protein